MNHAGLGKSPMHDFVRTEAADEITLLQRPWLRSRLILLTSRSGTSAPRFALRRLNLQPHLLNDVTTDKAANAVVLPVGHLVFGPRCAVGANVLEVGSHCVPEANSARVPIGQTSS